MADYAIGSYDFHSLTVKPRRSTQHFENEVRPGMDGHASFLTGTFGDPFESVSVADLTDDPTTIMHAYEQLIGTQQTLKYKGTTESVYYQVLDVRVLKEQDVILNVGGINGTSDGLLIAAWTLVATSVTVVP